MKTVTYVESKNFNHRYAGRNFKWIDEFTVF